jgi:hypothetical protein
MFDRRRKQNCIETAMALRLETSDIDSQRLKRKGIYR